MKRKAQTLVSYALYVGVGLSAVYLVVSTGTPFLQNIQESAQVREMISTMSEFENTVKEVTEGGEGTQQQMTFRLSGGSLYFENETFVYSITTGASAISSGTVRHLGEVTLRSNANVFVSNATYNGTRCYRMENDHIATCINKFGDGSSFEQGSLSNLILYVRNKHLNRTITPDFNLAVNDDSGYTTGMLRTVPIQVGSEIGRGHLSVLVDPPARPTYQLHVQLRSGSDFLMLDVR